MGAVGTPHPSSLWLATFPSRGRLLGASGAAWVRWGTPHTAHRTFPSGKSGVAVGLFCAGAPQEPLLRNARPPGLRPSEVRHLPPAHRNGPSACSGVAHGLFSINSPQDCLFRNAHAPGFAPPGEPLRGRLLGCLGRLGCGGDTSSVKPSACHLPLKGKAFGGARSDSGYNMKKMSEVLEDGWRDGEAGEAGEAERGVRGVF